MRYYERFILWLAVATLLPASTVLATEGSPPIPASIGVAGASGLQPGTVTAVVVKSWPNNAHLVWSYLNDHWSAFGSTPISIDYTTLIQVPTFTLSDLQSVGADVVIVSDAAGGLAQWSPAEVAALQTYALAGHNLVGTFALLEWEWFVGHVDNRALAPLWGLRADLDYRTSNAEPTTDLLEPYHCLFRSITGPLDLGGYPFVQVPTDLSWDVRDLAGAHFVGRGPSGGDVVTSYAAGPYDAFYISFMPEYQSGTDVEAVQWLYNAITCTESPVAVDGVSWGAVKARYRGIGP